MSPGAPAALALSVWLAVAPGPAAAAGDPADDDDVLFVAPRSPGPAGGPRGEAGGARVTVSGVGATSLAVDLGWRDGEDHVAWRAQLALRLDVELSPALTAELGARLEHVAWWTHRAQAAASTRAAIEPLLDAAVVRWRPTDDATLAVGLQHVRWGATSLARPFDVLVPHDLRHGPLPTLATPARPVFAVDLAHAAGPLRFELLWVPFFTPPAATLVGGDWSLLRGPWREAAPATLVDALQGLSPGARYRDQVAVALTEEPPMDGVTGAELGVRVHGRLGALDLALAWAWHWDRVPVITLGPEGVPPVVAVARSHLVGLSLAWTWEVLAFAVDATWSDRRSFITPDLETPRRPALQLAAEVGLRPTVWLDLTLGASALHVVDAPAEALLGAADLTARVLGRLGLLLAWEGALRLDVGGHYSPTLDDGAIDLRLTWRATRALELTLGVALFGGSAAHPSLGWLYAEHDSGYLVTRLAF